MKIGYLMPEFPGQTHIWMWREISHFREWGADIQLFSTRRPDSVTRAKHAFAEVATEETYYLWPATPSRLLQSALWALLNHTKGFFSMIKLGFSLDLDTRPAWRVSLPLLLIAPVLARKAQSSNIQHFHVHSAARSAILCMMVKKLVGIPYSMVCNSHLEGWGGAMGQKLAESEFTVAVAEWLYCRIRHDYPELAPHQLILSYTGVDTDKWRPSSKSALCHPNDRGRVFRIASIGRLHPAKGYDILIKAIKILVVNGRRLRLTIVGSGPSAESLQTLIANQGLSRHVMLAGSLSEDDIIELLSQSDLFCLASHSEPLGVVYMEAMSMGLPTIGTNAGGVPEIISHKRDGLLVPPANVAALAEAIEYLIDNPSLRKSLSVNSRKKVVEKFDSRIGARILYSRIYGSLPES